jgi:hypothetical protein
VLVAPGIDVDGDEILPPWIIRIGNDAFALDLLRSIPSSRLLERTSRASSVELQRARLALREIT